MKVLEQMSRRTVLITMGDFMLLESSTWFRDEVDQVEELALFLRPKGGKMAGVRNWEFRSHLINIRNGV
jgi:hypothetical protein